MSSAVIMLMVVAMGFAAACIVCLVGFYMYKQGLFGSTPDGATPESAASPEAPLFAPNTPLYIYSGKEYVAIDPSASCENDDSLAFKNERKYGPELQVRKKRDDGWDGDSFSANDKKANVRNMWVLEPDPATPGYYWIRLSHPCGSKRRKVYWTAGRVDSSSPKLSHWTVNLKVKATTPKNRGHKRQLWAIDQIPDTETFEIRTLEQVKPHFNMRFAKKHKNTGKLFAGDEGTPFRFDQSMQ